MTDDRRWKKAQAYERDHWRSVASSSEPDLAWYRRRAERLCAKLATLAPDLAQQHYRVLEVGGGPVGTATFMPGELRHAIDPLADYYASNPSLIKLRSEAVTYQQGAGESLPYEDAQFNIVVIENVIDHTKDPELVLREIHRVLEMNGILYLTVNVHTRWGFSVRRVMEVFQLDRGHPHTYTPGLARGLIERGGYQILSERVEDFEAAKGKERKVRRFRNEVKVALGIFDVLYEAYARPR